MQSVLIIYRCARVSCQCYTVLGLLLALDTAAPVSPIVNDVLPQTGTKRDESAFSLAGHLPWSWLPDFDCIQTIAENVSLTDHLAK